MAISGKQIAKNKLNEAAEEIGKTAWYFALHYYRLIQILSFIIEKGYKTKRKTVLELGVWPGYLALSLQKADFTVWGVDLDPKRIKQSNFELKIKSCDLNNIPLKIPYPEAQFDWVVASEVIEHINPANLPTLLSEINRILKNKGFAVITTPNKNSLHNNIFRKKTPQIPKNGHGHFCEYSIRELQKLFKNSPLTVLELCSVNFYSNIGTLSQNNYFYPLSHFWKHSNKFFNLAKLCSLPLKNIPPLKDSIYILVQKTEVSQIPPQ